MPARAGPPRSIGRTVVLVTLAFGVVIAGGGALWHRIAQVQQGAVPTQVAPGVTRDPATRARGAVLSISGQESRPRATYDPASGTVTVRFQSKYYDPKHTAAFNRQYLATEGRLVVQLVLYNVPEIAAVVAQLYDGGRLLATVTGTPSETYADYTVDYARGLP